MIRGIYNGSAGMLAEARKIDVISNNLANVDTAGFKKDVTTFLSFPSMYLDRINDKSRKEPCEKFFPTEYIGRTGSGVVVEQTFTDLSETGFKTTGNPMDFAIEGEGYFMVETPKGVAYTRNGSFKIDQNGTLSDQAGNPVLVQRAPSKAIKREVLVSAEGKAKNDLITLQVELGKEIAVDQDGYIYQGQDVLGRLARAGFESPKPLVKKGNNLFVTRPGVEAIGEGNNVVVQGQLEGSNVSAVKEMVNMVTAHRAFELNQKMVTTSDATLDKLIGYGSRE